jgi:hypothetical protein
VRSVGISGHESEHAVRLTVRGRDFEITVEGSIEDLRARLEDLFKFASEVSEKIIIEDGGEESAERSSSEETESAVKVADNPVIKATPSTTENLRALFNTPWGRMPRSLEEIAKALEVNTLFDKRENIGSALVKLTTKRGYLRSIMRDGKRCYYRIPQA